MKFVERWKAEDGQSTALKYPEERVVVLDGFEFREAGTRGNGNGVGYLTVRHPALGFRIRLRGDARDVGDRFGGAWVKPGLPVRVCAVLDGRNRELDELRGVVDAAAEDAGFASAEALRGRAGREGERGRGPARAVWVLL